MKFILLIFLIFFSIRLWAMPEYLKDLQDLNKEDIFSAFFVKNYLQTKLLFDPAGPPEKKKIGFLKFYEHIPIALDSCKNNEQYKNEKNYEVKRLLLMNCLFKNKHSVLVNDIEFIYLIVGEKTKRRFFIDDYLIEITPLFEINSHTKNVIYIKFKDYSLLGFSFPHIEVSKEYSENSIESKLINVGFYDTIKNIILLSINSRIVNTLKSIDKKYYNFKEEDTNLIAHSKYPYAKTHPVKRNGYTVNLKLEKDFFRISNKEVISFFIKYVIERIYLNDQLLYQESTEPSTNDENKNNYLIDFRIVDFLGEK